MLEIIEQTQEHNTSYDLRVCEFSTAVGTQ